MAWKDLEFPEGTRNRQMPRVQVDFSKPIGEGNERRTLDHLERPDRALKVYHERRPEMSATGWRGWAMRNFLSVRNRRQRRELECFLDLHLRGLTSHPDLPIARILGFRQTNHGPALEVEKIRRSPDDATVARTLRWLLESEDYRPDMPAALNNLMDRLEYFNIFVCDANYENIVMSQVDGINELILVDGFGDYRLIRLFSHAPWMVRRNIRNAFMAQTDLWGLPWDAPSGRFKINLPK